MSALKFRIRPLPKTKNGIRIGTPLAEGKGKQKNLKLNRVARIWFDDSMIFRSDGPDERTSYDSLVVATIYSDNTWLSLWIEVGNTWMPVATGYKSDRKITITPGYKALKIERKLTTQEINDLFNALFDNPFLLGED